MAGPYDDYNQSPFSSESLSYRLNNEHQELLPPEVFNFCSKSFLDSYHLSSMFKTKSGKHLSLSPNVAHSSKIPCVDLTPNDDVLCIYQEEWGYTVMQEITIHKYGKCKHLPY